MSNSRVAILGLVLGLVTAGASSSVHAQASGTGTHIAVVNLGEVYGKMQETVDSNNEINGMKGEFETTQKSHQGQLNEMQQKILNSAKPDSSQHAEMMTDYDAKSVQFLSEEKLMQLKIVHKQGRQLTQAFAEIQAMVADMAKKKGLDLVLVTNGNDLPPGAQDTDNMQNLATAILSRNVLYVSDKVNITAELIAALDAQYKNQAAGGAPPAK